MFGTQNLSAFVLAGLLLNLMPGPDTMYILGRSIAQGRWAGILSALGISSGGLCHLVAATLGLSALWTTLPFAFLMVKILGAIYLVYLGVRHLLDKTSSGSYEPMQTKLDNWKIYRQGLLTNLLNPKVSLFMLAFLPQFVRADANLGPIPFLFLGAIFIFNGTLWCLFLAVFSSTATAFVRKSLQSEQWLRRLTGLLFIGLGINLLRF